MTHFWTDTLKRLTPYVPGEQRSGDSIIKLNTNENPYPPSPAVLRALQRVQGDQIRRYPDPESLDLRQSLASYHKIAVENVFVGNGSDEILALAFMAYFTNGKSLQFPDISYSFYPVYCDLYNIPQSTIGLEADYSLNLDKFKPNAGAIIFPNPNAPTAMATPAHAVKELLIKHDSELLLVDEAYADFGAQSVIPLISDYPNLLISQTFSKGRSMAGLRLGVAFGSKNLIEGLQRLKNSFNSYPVDVLAQAAGIASLNDEAYYRKTIERIIANRQFTTDALLERGYEVLPSAANFVFAKPSATKASDVFNRLSEASVLVRYWDKPRLKDWLRISVGRRTDMQRLLSVLD